MSERTILVVLTSLVAEGTPVMVLHLADEWLPQGIRIHVATVNGAPGDLRPEFEARGIPVHAMRISPSGLRRYGELVRETGRLARQVGASAVLSMPFGWHALIALGARLAGVRNVVAHVGNAPPRNNDLPFWKFKLLVQLGRPWTSRLACCSEYVRKGVIERFSVSPRETEVIYNGCDVESIRSRAAATRARRETRSGPFRVGMVARLEMHKDQSTLVRAIALLEDIEVEAWIVGDGSRRAALEAEAHALGVAPRVRFFGTRRDIPEILGQLDVFAFAAKPDEGLGIALIEAMAAEVPIIATEVGACVETLHGAECGVLVPGSDPTALAEAIRTVALRGPDQRRLQAAAARASSQFSRRAMAERYQAILIPRDRAPEPMA